MFLERNVMVFQMHRIGCVEDPFSQIRSHMMLWVIIIKNNCYTSLNDVICVVHTSESEGHEVW